MEYIQTVLFQVTAASLERIAAPGGLIPELDEHRKVLKQQVGFEDMRVTRSINPEGNVLIVVETRWSSDESLVRYETNEPNVAGIVRKHEEAIVPESIQVLDMEALRTESSWAPAEKAVETRERVMLPILIPVGVLAFALLVTYGLSRVYLELSSTGATILAAAIAGGVLLAAVYFANNPRAPAWQMGGVMAAAALVLLGGAIWAVVEEDAAEGEGIEPAPAASTDNGDAPEPAGDGEVIVSMGDNFFDPNTITVSAGAATTFQLTNNGIAIHNMRIAGEDGEYNTDDDTVSDPAIVSGGGSATLNWTAPAGAGEIIFRCDFHPIEMTGTLTVE
ncbi:MAG: cupredoxin domain-containing protein [Dehalococcoidia bacterium]